MGDARNTQSRRPQADRRDGSQLPQGYQYEVRRAKRRIILSALADAGGSFPGAARKLEINRTYLHRLVNELGLRNTVTHLFPQRG